MNIGIYLPKYNPSIGGGFTFVDTVFRAFLQHADGSKHKFIIFCSKESFLFFRTEVETLSNVRLCKISKILPAFVTIKHFVPLVIPLIHRFSLLEKQIAKNKIDLVWFIGGKVHDTVDTPYIATVWDLQHRTDPWFPEVSKRGVWEYREVLYGRHLRRASHVITGTEVGRDQLGWYYQIPKDRISIMPHPVPMDIFDSRKIRAEVFADSDFLNKPFFFYPAQFWAHKNHVNLLLSMRELIVSYGKDVNIVFTGSDKGNLSYVKSVARRSGIEGNVFFLGFVTKEQLTFLYQNALALTYLSFSGPENLPPLEAFSFGCPVINSDFPGAREQLADAAIFVDPHSPDQIALHLNRFIENPSLREILIEKGKLRAKQRAPRYFVHNVLKIFDNFERVRISWSR